MQPGPCSANTPKATAPNFAEANQSFVNLGYRYATVPNPELSAENSKGLEFGLRASFPNAFLRVAAYRNRYTNFIESAFAGTRGSISLFQNRNIGEVTVRGAEFNARFFSTSNGRRAPRLLTPGATT